MAPRYILYGFGGGIALRGMWFMVEVQQEWGDIIAFLLLLLTASFIASLVFLVKEARLYLKTNFEADKKAFLRAWEGVRVATERAAVRYRAMGKSAIPRIIR